MQLKGSWRTHPAKMASHVTNGSFVRYPHIDKISHMTAAGIMDGGARIIFSAPPRHGKSFLMSLWTPAWFLSLFPDREVILVSYEASFAASWGRKVRNILEEYPDLHVKVARDSHAADRWHTTAKGGMTTAGMNGPITGKGGHCFVGATKVWTSEGELSISDIHERQIKPLVLSYSHRRQCFEWRKCTASKKSRTKRLHYLEAAGRGVWTTPDHPFFCGSEYRRADRFDRGSEVFAMRQTAPETSIRTAEGAASGPCRPLLLEGLLLEASLVQESKTMHGVRRARGEEDKAVLRELQTIGLAASIRRQIVSGLQHVISASLLGINPLLEEMFGSTTLQTDAPLGQLELQGRQAPHSSVQEDQAAHQGEGRPEVPYMPGYEAAGRASRRWGPSSRRVIESGHSMSALPHGSSQVSGVAIPADCGSGEGEFDVYDLEVEGNHNFLAEGILVHNCIIVDDYIKNAEEANSENQRNKAKEWWNTTLRTRLEPGGSIIVLATRWHQDDLIGYLTSSENENFKEWTVINLPAVCDSADDFMGRKIGEPLCPERYDSKALEDIKKSVGAMAWSALFQGNPVPSDGALFSRSMFEKVKLPEKFEYSFITADTAYSDKKSNDFTVFTCFGVIKDQMFVRDVWRKQIKAADIEEPVIKFIQRFSKYGFRGALIEPKGHGIYLNQWLPRKGIMVPSESTIKEFFEDRKLDKVQRANNAVPHLANRKIYLNKDIQSVDDLVSECLAFPKGKHDDFVDTLVDGIKYVYGRSYSMFDTM